MSYVAGSSHVARLVPKFRGKPKDRYHVWRKRIEYAMKALGLWKLLIGEDLRPDFEEGGPITEEEFNATREVVAWDLKEETAAAKLMAVLGDDIVNDLMDVIGDPVAMWFTLERTYSSQSGTNILSILNGVITKKLGSDEDMAKHIGKLDSGFHQLSDVQHRRSIATAGRVVDEGRNLTVTEDIFKSCMLLASISEIGEYEAVIESIRGVSDEEGTTHNATSYRAVKNRLLESYTEKHPVRDAVYERDRRRRHIQKVNMQGGILTDESRAFIRAHNGRRVDAPYPDNSSEGTDSIENFTRSTSSSRSSESDSEGSYDEATDTDSDESNDRDWKPSEQRTCGESYLAMLASVMEDVEQQQFGGEQVAQDADLRGGGATEFKPSKGYLKLRRESASTMYKETMFQNNAAVYSEQLQSDRAENNVSNLRSMFNFNS